MEAAYSALAKEERREETIELRVYTCNTVHMSPNALQLENKKLNVQLAERDAMIIDRDAKIEELARDLRSLEKHLKRLLSGRGGHNLIAEGQGVLFPVESSGSEQVNDAEDSGETADDEGDDKGDDDDQDKHAKRSKSPPKKIDTSALPREDRVHELPKDERLCPETGQALVPIGEKTFEEIHFERAQLSIIVHRQIVYGLPPEQAENRQAKPLTAPMPPRALENCAASAALLAWMIVQKYANHLPLYRQEQIFARDGLRLSRQTLCDWVLGAADALKAIADCLMARVRAGPIMQLDDTPVMCQGGRGEKNFQAYLWTFVNPDVSGVVYRFTAGRGSDLIANELGNFEGFLGGDGYSGNKAAAKKVMDKKVAGEIVMFGCWAHTTRKFRDALCEVPGTAQLFRDDIKELYDVESEANEAKLDPDARLALRQRKSRSILAKLLRRARRLRHQYSEAGKMAGAIGYLLNQRKPLSRFLEDGRLPLDNNRCERSIRPIAIGRRNWLFTGSVRGGRAAATIYTLIESCRYAGIDMVSYLADVLVRVATHPASRIEELLPEHWAKTVAASSSGSPTRSPELALA